MVNSELFFVLFFFAHCTLHATVAFNRTKSTVFSGHQNKQTRQGRHTIFSAGRCFFWKVKLKHAAEPATAPADLASPKGLGVGLDLG